MKNENELIAEFMELKTAFHDVKIWMDDDNKSIPEWDKRDYWLERELKYHTSWDWLMPVVEKIESIEENYDNRIITKWVHILGKGCIIEIDKGFTPDIIVCSEFNNPISKIEATYLAVIEFIKLYNKNKK